MKLECVLTACNLDPKYFEFIDYFVRAWKTVLDNVDVKVILVSNHIPDSISHLQENIILFPPIPNVSDVFISQYIRLLYPSILKYINGVLITDIDMIPMNSEYYVNNISHLPGDSFVSYRDELIEEYSQIPMCYCAANSQTWSEMFDVSTISDIQNRLVEKYDQNWCRDQMDLYTHVKQFQRKHPKRTFILMDRITGFHRLNRTDRFSLTGEVKRNIRNRKYTDYHVYRPYYKYVSINNDILELLQLSRVNESYF